MEIYVFIFLQDIIVLEVCTESCSVYRAINTGSFSHLYPDLGLINAGVSPSAIAVQSPYVAQVQLLRDRLDEIPMARGIEVSTIDSFQGREADAVIISMVCSWNSKFSHGHQLRIEQCNNIDFNYLCNDIN